MSARGKQYEPGMRIAYDSHSGKVTVTFRGRIAELPNTYACEADAVVAGESFCRERGWEPDAQVKKSFRTVHRFWTE